MAVNVLALGESVYLLFDEPDPLRMASLPVASIAATMADGGADDVIKVSKVEMEDAECVTQAPAQDGFIWGVKLCSMLEDAWGTWDERSQE